MSDWKEKALDALHRSLYPVLQEVNEIDWKGGLSDKTDRLGQHICAFANLKGDVKNWQRKAAMSALFHNFTV